MYDLSHEFFETRRAESEEEIRAAHRVRHQVYCRESGYFTPEAFPDGLEIDAYDVTSMQSLVIYKPTGDIVGAVRLILPAPEIDGRPRFPFDAVCAPSAREGMQKAFRTETGEVSRFCVTRKLTDLVLRGAPSVVCERLGLEKLDRPTARAIAGQAKIRLLECVVDMCRQAQVGHLLAVMEPFLLQVLSELGVHFINVGPTVHYHGERQPCYAPLDWLLSVLRRERDDVWDVVTDRGRLVKARGTAYRAHETSND